MLTANKRNELIGKFEKIKGYSCKVFDNQEWREFDYFCKGFEMAEKESEEVYRYGEQRKTYRKKDGTVILPSSYEGVDG